MSNVQVLFLLVYSSNKSFMYDKATNAAISWASVVDLPVPLNIIKGVVDNCTNIPISAEKKAWNKKMMNVILIYLLLDLFVIRTYVILKSSSLAIALKMSMEYFLISTKESVFCV